MSIDSRKPVRRPLSVVGSVGSRRSNSETSTLRRQSLAALSFLAENDPAALADLADVYGDGAEPRSSLDTAKTGSDNPFSIARLSGLSSGSARADEENLSGEESSDGGSAWHVDDERRVSSSASASRRSGSRLSRRSSASRNSSDRRLMSATKVARLLGTTRGEVLQRVVRRVSPRRS